LSAVLAALVFSAARTAHAQLPPNEHWRTLRTQHFRVHFTPALEEEARRAAVNAERAYSELSTELVPPRGLTTSTTATVASPATIPYRAALPAWRRTNSQVREPRDEEVSPRSPG
jgi:hypothetical protein